MIQDVDAQDEQVRQGAEHILADYFGDRIQVEAADKIDSSPRSRVKRLRVLAGPTNAPQSVIVKQAAEDEEASFAPDALVASATWRFFNDWAGLQFLNEVFEDERPAPRLYGADRRLGLLVLEDLSGYDTLTTPLLGNNPTVAEASLQNYMVTLGKLHGRTIGKQATFFQIRDGLGRNPPYFSPAAENFFPPTEIATVFHNVTQRLQITPIAGIDKDLARVAAFWDHQGPFWAYTHGDPVPGNEFYVGSQRKFIDFEFGGFRHALTEGIYARMQFVTGWCAARIPDAVVQRMEDAYRAELCKGCPEASDNRVFYSAIVEACAYATIAMWRWVFPNVLQEDEAWGLSTYRQRILRRLDILADAAARFGHLEALGAMAYTTSQKLRGLWPPEADVMPYYPAFQ